MSPSGHPQNITFNDSAVDACFDYLKNPSDTNLERLVALPGSQLAYNHHIWSSMDSTSTIKQFWKKTLQSTPWNTHLQTVINNVKEYLTNRRQSEWLNPVLNYLPQGHVFKTTVYLIVNYDNIVYGEDVALNLNHSQFHTDHREIIYYLIHELAHAGYFRYRQMPQLTKMKTIKGLSDTIKLLTHLEGMGVISPMKLRLKQGGLLDNDYQTLLNPAETKRRVRQYFRILSKLENKSSQTVQKEDLRILNQMSRRPKRLWYMTGCYMAQKIEQKCGIETLRNLVKEGHQEFFETYRNLENPLTQ
jgi:hypothetical protein